MALDIGLSTAAVTIASGTSLSGSLAIGALVPVGLWMPAAWTPANITVQASPDGGETFLEFVDSAGNAITVTVAAGQLVAFSEVMWQSVNFLKLRSGTLASPVAQSADRIINLVLRDFVR